MVYFCADDYGISAYGNEKIEDCIENGALNKVSILANGEAPDFKKRLTDMGASISLHLNLVEGKPLCDVPLLTADNGYFKRSFAGLFLLCLSGKRKEVKKQLYREIQGQVRFFKNAMGEDVAFCIDSHQHTHMIPLVFKTLMEVIAEEGVVVQRLRFPEEPILPYILTPSLYFEYTLSGFVKQWILKILGLVNRGELKRSGISRSLFMGVMFSGRLTQKKIKKMLPRYLKIAEKKGMDVEIGFHPGYVENENHLISGNRGDFGKFYFSPWRKKEYDTLINYK